MLKCAISRSQQGRRVFRLEFQDLNDGGQRELIAISFVPQRLSEKGAEVYQISDSEFALWAFVVEFG